MGEMGIKGVAWEFRAGGILRPAAAEGWRRTIRSILPSRVPGRCVAALHFPGSLRPRYRHAHDPLETGSRPRRHRPQSIDSLSDSGGILVETPVWACAELKGSAEGF